MIGVLTTANYNDKELVPDKKQIIMTTIHKFQSDKEKKKKY
ncbi:hypothetical protein [Vallitalea maricola]